MLQGYAHMVDFFTSFDWWKTEPHDELVNRGNYCLAKPGEMYARLSPPRWRCDHATATGSLQRHVVECSYRREDRFALRKCQRIFVDLACGARKQRLGAPPQEEVKSGDGPGAMPPGSKCPSNHIRRFVGARISTFGK